MFASLIHSFYSGPPLHLLCFCSFLNCKGAQYGSGGNDMAMILSYGKEGRDLFAGSNTWDASCADNYANKIGRLMGTKYP
ncbi:MAG: hypothetical protein IKV03_06595, partial [Alphaproteobacteria bacterium]|nr:hypothetical protein [Alphaproteobacteria bacterium]